MHSKKRRGTGFVFDNKSDDLENQRKQLLQKFNEITEKNEDVLDEAIEEQEAEEKSEKVVPTLTVSAATDTPTKS